MPKHKGEGNLYSRFILRVLAPPFIALLIVGVIALQQLGTILHRQAIDGLKRSAVATAATLEREFSLRETVLKQTGAELFVIKNEYTTNRQNLDSNRNACRVHIKQNLPYTSAPNGVCEPFNGGFDGGRASLLALENEYVKLGEASIQDQNQRTNERLSAFKQFFPETLVILVLDDKKQVVSSAHSGAFKGSNEIFQPEAASAQASPIRGKVMSASDFKLVTFAFQIPGGSVLAAYDLQNEHFIRQAWLSAPIDRSRASAVLLDASGTPVYPVFKNSDDFKKNIDSLREKPFLRCSSTMLGTLS